MPSLQIIKNKIPDEHLFALLDKICIKNNKYYTFNLNSYKKGMYSEDIPKFIQECIPYYYLSKRKYLERKITYKSFITVLRQICNYNKITYTSKIVYNKCEYNIEYYVYMVQ